MLPALIRTVAATGTPGAAATVSGWVRSVRRQKAVAFVDLADGSSGGGMQVVVEGGELPAGVATGAAVAVTGVLAQAPGGGKGAGSGAVVRWEERS